MPFIASLRRTLFGINPSETTVAKRGFTVDSPEVVERLEGIGTAFVYGYHQAMINTNSEIIAKQLDSMDDLWRGFAYEGAGMALTLLDLLTPWNRRRFDAFLKGPGDDHIYMVHVGAGWALARLARRLEPHLKRVLPIWRSLVVDGYGFHEGYFNGSPYYELQKQPKKLTEPHYFRAFDQGLGRAMWFVAGCNVVRLQAMMVRFEERRHSDLWSGIGLAATYAGGVPEATLKELQLVAGNYENWLAQGAAFAVKARLRARNLVAHTEIASQILCGCTVDATAHRSDEIFATLDLQDPNAYEHWRTKLKDSFATEPA